MCSTEDRYQNCKMRMLESSSVTFLEYFKKSITIEWPNFQKPMLQMECRKNDKFIRIGYYTLQVP